jgi:hypothetical protein
VLQKRAHTRNDERPVHLQSSKVCGGALCNLEWLLGFLLFAIAPIPFAMLSLALAGQSLIMPLTGGPCEHAQSPIAFDPRHH